MRRQTRPNFPRRPDSRPTLREESLDILRTLERAELVEVRTDTTAVKARFARSKGATP